ncbi:PDZ domain-containing protein 8-like [Lethenteron reissneri]|uniref:PDZ domain-containing protein 8-like n=1 Tax=Lethenteron reissneri TaxID=7753 RepID=UPI002AB77969|nr:PDZ domain-containing protein 8-like [Lethenteron reissneri]
MLGVAILTALLASIATVAIQLLLLLRFLSSSSSSSTSSSSTSSSSSTYPPRGAVTTSHPRLLSLLRGASSSVSTTTSTPLSSTSSTTTTSSSTSTSASAASAASSAPPPSPYEACRCLNALLLSVFSELRGSSDLRAWVTRNIHVEMLELLQSRTAGRVVEGLSLRDVSLGDALPVFHGVRTVLPSSSSRGNAAGQQAGDETAAELPDELELEADVEYTGGCYVCVHAELVFGKRAELFVRIARVRGPLRVRVTRAPPLAHWSFAFTRDPRAELEVRSRYEGRPMPQLTTVIVNQIKKVLRRKHTLPSYKIRYKPFFPSHVQGDGVGASLPMAELKRGTLKVQLVGCSRLLLPTAPDKETDVYCSLELATTKCTGGVRFLFIEIQISKGTSPLIGLTFRQISVPDGDPDIVVVSTVVPNTPAASADVRKDDRVVSIAGHNVYSLVHAGKLLASADPVRIVLQREELPTGAVYSSHPPAGATVSAPPVASASVTKNLPVDDPANPDSDFEDLCLAAMNEAQAADEAPRVAAGSFKQSPAPPAPAGAAAVAAAKNASPGGSPSHSAKPREGAAAYCSKAAKASDGCAAECPRVPADANASESQDASGTSGPVKPPVPPRPKDKPESAPDADAGAGGPSTARPAKGLAEQAAKAAAAKADAASAEEAQSARATARADEWTSTKAAYGNNACAWTDEAADCAELQVEGHHKYLNVLVWCQERVAPGARPACATATCVGHASVAVDEIVSECLDTGSLQFYRTYLLRPPDPKPAALLCRPQFKQLASHKGFNEELCFGEVTLHFSHTYTDDFKGASAGPKAVSKTRRTGSPDNDASDSEKDDGALRTREASKHDFKDALFQNPTNCDYCKNQIWTNSASRCSRCAYVCHKKCREKYQTEKPRCLRDGAGPRTRQTDRQRPQSMHKAAALARNLIPYARKRLQLRPGAKRTGDDGPPETAHGVVCETDGAGGGGGADEGCDAADRTCRGSAGANRGGLHDSVFVAVKEIGRALYRDLPSAERQQKLELMLEKLQCEIEVELERNSALKQDLAAAASAEPARATAELIAVEVRKSNERLQALTLLMLHYRAGLEDLELAQVDPPEAAPELAAHSEEREERRGGNLEGGGRESARCGDLGGKARCAEASDARPQGPLADVAAEATEQEEGGGGGGGDDDQISLERVDVEERADVETSAVDQRLEGTEEEASELEVGDDTDCEKT